MSSKKKAEVLDLGLRTDTGSRKEAHCTSLMPYCTDAGFKAHRSEGFTKSLTAELWDLRPMKKRIHRVTDGEVLGSEAHEGRVHRVGGCSYPSNALAVLSQWQASPLPAEKAALLLKTPHSCLGH